MVAVYEQDWKEFEKNQVFKNLQIL